MRDVKFGVAYKETASRLSVVVRFILILPFFFVYAILTVFAFLVCLIQAICVLVTSKRNKTLFNFTGKWLEIFYKFGVYFYAVSDKRPMGNAKFLLRYSEKSSRAELVYRIFYSIAYTLVVQAFESVSSLAMFVQYLYILVYAKRHPGLQLINRVFVEYNTKVNAYIFLCTDEHPEFFPEGLLQEHV